MTDKSMPWRASDGEVFDTRKESEIHEAILEKRKYKESFFHWLDERSEKRKSDNLKKIY